MCCCLTFHQYLDGLNLLFVVSLWFSVRLRLCKSNEYRTVWTFILRVLGAVVMQISPSRDRQRAVKRCQVPHVAHTSTLNAFPIRNAPSHISGISAWQYSGSNEKTNLKTRRNRNIAKHASMAEGITFSENAIIRNRKWKRKEWADWRIQLTVILPTKCLLHKWLHPLHCQAKANFQHRTA